MIFSRKFQKNVNSSQYSIKLPSKLKINIKLSLHNAIKIKVKIIIDSHRVTIEIQIQIEYANKLIEFKYEICLSSNKSCNIKINLNASTKHNCVDVAASPKPIEDDVLNEENLAMQARKIIQPVRALSFVNAKMGAYDGDDE